ncbi:MAG: fibrillarin-like rRNA/tRNA 2'-O-methyltransferase [Nanoarchaeota archaeon]|nr:fibrillarin-like rRNA/tRNA 2'-O-methyltransferase [Nanoarchaeota archaeon]MBU1854338.1 fibrillarin-like rRNA/tRNA 2'-O-methyltransferase [Nanoarchaeota archaeon]
MKLLNNKFPNIFIEKNSLYTKSVDKKTFFDEKTFVNNNIFFREWDPKRSKLAAGLMKGLSQIGLKEGSIVLYLGASHGYTPSFISDIISNNGFMFCVEFSPEVARDLVTICEAKKNMVPILADANHPEIYKELLTEVDIVYQDIAQKNQVQIFLRNCDAYLKKEGFGLLAIKARSIDVTKKPRDIYQQVRSELEKYITIVDYRELEPFEKDHAIFVVKKK